MPERTLCLGEALVDLICEQPIEDVAQADAFVPHFGGAVANVALVAARAGARIALAGGAGADGWGEWLREHLRAAGVELSLFELIEDRATPLAIVAVDDGGEASYSLYGDVPSLPRVLARGLEGAVEESAALFISSNTLVAEDEREVTMRAREVALTLEKPVIFDPNLRLHRWRSVADAAASANACVSGALLVRCNQVEASVMTREEDPERAAMALVKGGARLVVVTLGSAGAMLRGALTADVPGVRPARILSTAGAGDVLTGTLLARLAATGFYPAAVAAGLREAVAASARACERWGAVD